MKNKILMSFLLFIFMIFYAVPSFGASFYVKVSDDTATTDVTEIKYFQDTTGGGTANQFGLITIFLGDLQTLII